MELDETAVEEGGRGARRWALGRKLRREAVWNGLEVFRGWLKTVEKGEPAMTQLAPESSAVFTIIKNEPVFFPLWLKYYSQLFAPENIFVFDNDTDDATFEGLAGFRRIHVPHEHAFDHAWLNAAVRTAQKKLLTIYKTVLFAEADEFVVPRTGTLGEYLQTFDHPYMHCEGYNVVHIPEKEAPLDFTKPVLAQRKFWTRMPMFDKPLLSRIPLDWCWGFHHAGNADRSIAGELFLVHLHNVDYQYSYDRKPSRTKMKWSPRDLMNGDGGHNRIQDANCDHAAAWHSLLSSHRIEEIPLELVGAF